MRRGFDYSGVFHYIQKTLERSAWTDLDTAVNIFFVIVLLAGVVFFILCDGLTVKGLKKHLSIVDGDCKSISIAAASIVAKVYRDSLMRKFSREYSHYKFSRNKGYGTKAHQDALRKYGLSEIHRTSFELTKFLSQ